MILSGKKKQAAATVYAMRVERVHQIEQFFFLVSISNQTEIHGDIPILAWDNFHIFTALFGG